MEHENLYSNISRAKRKTEPLTALESHRKGTLISAVPHSRQEGKGNEERKEGRKEGRKEKFKDGKKERGTE